MHWKIVSLTFIIYFFSESGENALDYIALRGANQRAINESDMNGEGARVIALVRRTVARRAAG